MNVALNIKYAVIGTVNPKSEANLEGYEYYGAFLGSRSVKTKTLAWGVFRSTQYRIG